MKKKSFFILLIFCLNYPIYAQDLHFVSADLYAKVMRHLYANQIYLRAQDSDQFWNWLEENNLVESEISRNDVFRILKILEIMPVQPKTGTVSMSEEEFDRVQQNQLEELAHLKDIKFNEFTTIIYLLSDWYRFTHPNPFPMETALQTTDTSFVVLQRSKLDSIRENINRLTTYLEQIENANAADSTLVFRNSIVPEVTENFWGDTFVEMESDVDILTPDKELIATIHIENLKSRAYWTLPFYKVRAKAVFNAFYDSNDGKFKRDIGAALSSLNYRRFDMNLVFTTKLYGIGIGYNVSRNFGPMLGLGIKYGVGLEPILSMFFSFN